MQAYEAPQNQIPDEVLVAAYEFEIDVDAPALPDGEYVEPDMATIVNANLKRTKALPRAQQHLTTLERRALDAAQLRQNAQIDAKLAELAIDPADEHVFFGRLLGHSAVKIARTSSPEICEQVCEKLGLDAHDTRTAMTFVAGNRQTGSASTSLIAVALIVALVAVCPDLLLLPALAAFFASVCYVGEKLGLNPYTEEK